MITYCDMHCVGETVGQAFRPMNEAHVTLGQHKNLMLDNISFTPSWLSV